MQARLIAFIPDSAAITRTLVAGERLRIGRADECELVLAHRSISRVHAELIGAAGGWSLIDLGSKNGTFVEGAQVASTQLTAACWLRFGDVHCEFAALDPMAAEADAHYWRERHRAATAYTVQLDTLAHAGGAQAAQGRSLLDASLRAVTELSGCSRGFVLIDSGGHYRVGASLALDPADMIGRQFAGSLGAVKRAVENRQTVVFNDLEPDAGRSHSASVIRGGLRTLVCLPLLDGERALGAIYADRREPGPPLTTLDLELLEAFADRTALWLSASGASEDLAGHAPVPLDWGSLLGSPVLQL